MFKFNSTRPAVLAFTLALTHSAVLLADDMVYFATGGYVTGLRTKSMMHKIDTDGDGTISHDEYMAFQTKIFDMLDTSEVHRGMLSPEEMFATGGANRN